MIHKFLFSSRSQDSTAEALGDLLFRVALGLSMAFAHGLGKLPPSDQFVQGVANLGFPLPLLFTWCASLAEFLGGIFIAMGLMTRATAANLAFTMGVAFFVQHGADPFAKKELAWLYLISAAWFLFAGAGRYSLDAFISKRR
jgi:putative oxidoreductase